jgi:phosphoesterase RecJ-like protein
VTTHIRPDGDALGTAAAMVLALKNRGIDSRVLLLSHLPRKYAFIFNDYGISHFDAEPVWPAALNLNDYDALLVVDTGTWSQLPGLQERIKDWHVPRLVLDHHQTQEDWADLKLVQTDAAAAGEIAAQVLDQWQIPFDRPIATALYLAIASDTGWFQFSNTRPFTHRLAARLMEAGVDTDAMYQHVYQSEAAARLALQVRAMQSLELLLDNRAAVMILRDADFSQTRSGPADTENLVNIPLQVESVQVAMLMTQTSDGTRISFRSKGRLNVAALAERLGGGGHVRAAGVTLRMPVDQARAAVVAMLQACIGGI